MIIQPVKTNIKPGNKQLGIVTIFFSLMLLFMMSLLALAVNKLVIVEQESAGAAYREGEAAQATTAGIEYALAWLDDDNDCDNCVVGTALSFEGASVSNTEMPNISNAGTGYSYNPMVTLTRANLDAPSFMLVGSSLDTVTGNTESGVTITGSEQVYVTLWNEYLTQGGEGAPPIVINGCLTNITGGPVVFPKPDSPAMLTLATGAPVADFNNLNSADCLFPGHMDIELCSGDQCPLGDSGSALADHQLGPYLQGTDMTLNNAPQAWNYLFHVSLPDAIAIAAAAGQSSSNANAIPELQPADDNYVPFIHYSGSNPLHGTFGTSDYPVVLILTDPGCPHFNSGSTVYGFLYYSNPLGSCNGMGGATVIGSAVFEGDADSLNANTEIYDALNLGSGGGDPGGPLFTKHAARIPGTWRDW